MSGVLVLSEIRAGAVRPITAELITLAAELRDQGAGPVTVAVVGEQADQHVDAVSKAGVDTVVTVPTDRPEHEALLAAAALDALIEALAPAIVLAGHTVDAMSFVPAVAATRRTGFASDVVDIAWEDGAPVARRGVFGDRLLAEVDFPGKPCSLLMVRAGARPAAQEAGTPAVERLAAVATPAGSATSLGFVAPEATGVDITKAEIVLAIGRGVDDEQMVSDFEELAEALGATLAVSRPLVDAGWAPAYRQVGQSGRSVKPKVYLAMGISGAVQHLAGMRDSETIIAVNKDPEAPIFSAAHFGVVADLFDVADALKERVS